MARSVLYPRFRLAVGERDGDERGARVVRADLLARVGTLEQDGAIDAGGDEMLTVFRGGVVDVDAFAAEVDEDEVVGLGRGAVLGKENAPCVKGSRDARRQGPRAWVVGLVDIEDNAAAIEVEVGPREACRFVDSWALSMKEAIKDAVLERNGIGRNELGIFVGVDPTLRFAGADFREESGRQWVCRDELQRKNCHLANAMEQLRNLSTRSHRTTLRNASHNDARMVERKCINANIADNGVYVVFETAYVVTDRFLHAHVIGVIAGKVAPSPSLAQFANGGHFCIRLASLTNKLDIAEDLLEGFRVCGGCGRIEIRAGDIEAPGLTEFVGDFGKGGGAGVSLRFGLAGRKGDGGAIG